MFRGYNKFVELISKTLDPSWKKILVDLSLNAQTDDEEEKKSVTEIRTMIDNLVTKEYVNDKSVRPSFENIFDDFKTCLPNKLSVVIMFYDKPLNPARISNIVEELYDEYKYVITSKKSRFKESYNLNDLNSQGVLITTFMLTNSSNNTNFHMELWARYMLRIIKAINHEHKYLVYLLWENRLTNVARAIKENEFDSTKKKTDSDKRKIISYLVLSCETMIIRNMNKFKGSNHFIITNHFLKHWYKPTIDWTCSK